MTPGPAHLELKRSSQVARAHVLLGEWPRLMDGGAANGNPVKQRRGVQVKVLAEQILVHLHRRLGVTADGEFNARIQDEMSVAPAQCWRDTGVKDRVEGVAFHNGQLTGKRE